MSRDADATVNPRVYLAHATADKPIVRPLAEQLMANGVDVWLDEWDIEVGDSLRQKMEAGLSGMTHFVVVLTPTALKKPWVAMEIDAGILGKIGGESHFVPLLVGVQFADLPIFLRTMLGIRLDPNNPADLKSLVDRLHGVSRRPELGPIPDHVRAAGTAPAGWSAAAVAIARVFVTTSEHAMTRDPVLALPELAAGTSLADEDVRLGALELAERGHLWEGAIRGHFAPECAMFADFDGTFMTFSPSDDAAVVAKRMLDGPGRLTDTRTLADELGWAARRMNSAICYLAGAGAIEQRHALANRPWRAVQLVRTDRTLRFARDRS